MKYKLLLITLMAILMAGTVYGAVSCEFQQAATTVGTSNTYIRGSAKNLSVNLTGWTDDANTSVAIISAGAAGCTISGTLTFNSTGHTITNQSYMNTTVNTLAMKDDTSCTFTMTIKNASNQATLTTCTRAYISDNTKPKCIHSQSSKTDYLPSQTWTVTGTNGSSATIKFGANSAFTMNEASDVFTYTATKSTLPENTYNPVTASVSDGLNITSCDLDYVTISSKSGLVQVAAAGAASAGAKMAEQTVTTSSNRNLLIGLLLAALVFWYVKRKK